MGKSLSDYYAKKRMEKKASKQADVMHLSYCWLRASGAETSLEQLSRSHDLTPVVMLNETKEFEVTLSNTIEAIKHLKDMIKKYQEHLKTLKGKR